MRVLRDGVVVAGVGVFVIVGFCGGAIGSVGGKKKAPAAGELPGRMYLAISYSPTLEKRSTIGGARLNCRVRNGNGWDPRPIIAKSWRQHL
jgi:hypothetical protein